MFCQLCLGQDSETKSSELDVIAQENEVEALGRSSSTEKDKELDVQKNKLNEDAVKMSSEGPAETAQVPMNEDIDEEKKEDPSNLAKPPEVEPAPDPSKLASPPVQTEPCTKNSTDKTEDTQNATTETAGWKFNVDQAKWASADCQVVQQCQFSFDAKKPGVRMLPEEVANKIYKKWVGAKTMWCHNICVYKGVTGVATVLAEEHGLTFTTTDAIWDFLVAEKPPEAGCCRKCVGRFEGSLTSSVLTCKGGLVEHDHDNTCSELSCLFIKSGLQCPVQQMVPWALKEKEFKTAKRPKSFPSNFSGF